MTDLARRIERARAQVQIEWTDQRERQALRDLYRRRQLRTGARLGGSVGLMLLVALLAQHALRGPGPVPSARLVAAPIHLRDGSTVVPLSPDAVVRLLQQTQDRIDLTLERGGARFQVTASPPRIFRVQARFAAVEVQAAQFTLELARESVRIAVEQGHARVLWDTHSAELQPGQSGIFPPAGDSLQQHAVEGPTEPASAPAQKLRPRRTDRPAPNWRTLAAEGRFDQAYSTLQQHRFREVADEPGDLLLLADVARLGHHPAQAVAPLGQVLHNHAGDPRAPLAAFTLGRVLLDDLGRPQEAAAAFLQARDLDPEGPMSQDALAREVEAWSLAGEKQRAQERARLYVQRYPQGRRLLLVRRYGALE